MNIVMMTNTYLPHVSGVANSVDRFARAYRTLGHNVLIVAPKFEGPARDGTHVVRVPAIQNFNGSDFSVVLPVPLYLTRTLNQFRPDVIHSHQPFLLGDTASRAAASRAVPLVFTYHTMYEEYTHYVPFGAQKMRDFIIELSTRYANGCDRVIVPSRSVGKILKSRGVTSSITEIPTGIDPAEFRGGDGRAFRKQWNIPADAPVAGYVGRLAPEKNLDFLADAMAMVLLKTHAHFLAVGSGPSEQTMRSAFEAAGVGDRVHFTGNLSECPLVDAYHAMDLFVFASLTETQGMVLVEAMAAGVPVVALDGPGVREVVRDEVNGLKLQLANGVDAARYAQAVHRLLEMSKDEISRLRRGAFRTAARFSTARCADKALALYQEAIDGHYARPDSPATEWETLRRLIEQEWNLWSNRLAAASTFIAAGPAAGQQ